jgi:hypothetical protein
VGGGGSARLDEAIPKTQLSEVRTDSLPEFDHAGPRRVVRFTGMQVMPK